MKNTGKLRLYKGETYGINAAVVSVLYNNIRLTDLSKENGGLLILIGHNKLQTLMDVSGIKNHLLLGFDSNKKYIGTTYCNTEDDNNFIVSSQARFALLLDASEIHFDVSDIKELETEFYIEK